MKQVCQNLSAKQGIFKIAYFIYWYIVCSLGLMILRKYIYRFVSQKYDHQEIFYKKKDYEVSIALHLVIFKTFIFKTSFSL